MSDVVVITGGTAGVGRATARRFATAGARVAVLARGADGLAACRREGMHAIACDVADYEQVALAADEVERRLGPIDIWINNAMTTVFGSFLSVSPREFQRITEVTYLGQVWGTRVALERMKPRDRGTIIQVGSALAYRSIPLQSGYCGAKHAIVGFTDSIRSELIHDGSKIRICAVHLPAVNTPQFRHCANRMDKMPQPVPPIFQPELIANAIHRAAYHPRREMFLGWPAIKAVWGGRVAPGYADRVLAKQGYDGQLTERAARPHPTNLWEPVEGDQGAHGDFDDRARPRDPVLSASAWLGAAGVTATLGAALVFILRKRWS